MAIRVWAVATATALAATLAAAPAASAEFADVFGGDVSCAVQASNGNVRLCSGTTTTWDGKTKIDVNVILPPAPASEPDGPYPLIGDFHGWGGSKIGINDQTQGWAENGYAVFSMSDRGWGESCGATDPARISESEACAAGYNHLMDDRYEVRDAQYLISLLADEGVAQPQKIGTTGMSYGGGISMALATLRDRTMLPDGSLAPWESPEGKAMELAAAVPQWPWTDLAYSLMPNGRTLDYVADAPYLGPDGKAPIGIEKASYVDGLYGLGLAESNYAPAKADPDADLTTWYTLVSAGEPYDANPEAQAVIEEITTHHSSYYIDHSEEPAPLLIQSGWNDDLFPVDEALRYYNRTRTQFPADPISLFLMDDGHARSQNKAADVEAFEDRENAWFDHYLKGEGPAPQSSVEALTTTCPKEAASEGPYSADNWRHLAPGEIRFKSLPPQVVTPGAGDPTIGQKFDPIAGEGACASVSSADQSGVATYRLPAVPAGGFTLIGSPTVIAGLASTSPESELAARLLDVAPGGEERLVARGLLRPGAGGPQMVFQLHPQAYRFAAGDIPKLELLPSDSPYARPSNAQGPITVSNLELRLPVLEQPGSLGGMVQKPAAKIVPPGYALARDYLPTETEEEEEEEKENEEEETEEENEGGGAGGSGGGSGSGGASGSTASGSSTSTKPGGPGTTTGTGLTRGKIRVTRRALFVQLHCHGPSPCSGRVSAKLHRRTIATGPYSLAAGETKVVRLPLNKAGRRAIARLLRHHKKPHIRLIFFS